jgi:orotate phosphoribosyltransferase
MQEKKRILFNWAEFQSHSGLKLPFKIDCDSLTDDDIRGIAKYIAPKTSFEMVIGIPQGGLRLAEELEEYTELLDAPPFSVILVDDVLTTGASMEQWKAKISQVGHTDDVLGWVIFARVKPPAWINAVFTMIEPGAREINIGRENGRKNE